MNASEANSEITLQLKRSFSVSPEQVFAAWTEVEHLKKWFAPSDLFQIPELQVDLKVGGSYRIAMQSPEGETYTVIGEYVEIQAPQKLVYTWAWEGTPMEQQPTRVTVEFLATEAGTDVLLTHELFPNAEERDKHQQGWNGCLGRLEKLMAH